MRKGGWVGREMNNSEYMTVCSKQMFDPDNAYSKVANYK